MPLEFDIRAQIWLYEGKSVWHFVRLPKDISARIKSLTAGKASNGGSVRVSASIGATRWRTSIFPDTKTATYLLPIKAAVRVKEQLRAGETVEIVVCIDVVESA